MKEIDVADCDDGFDDFQDFPRFSKNDHRIATIDYPHQIFLARHCNHLINSTSVATSPLALNGSDARQQPRRIIAESCWRMNHTFWGLKGMIVL